MEPFHLSRYIDEQVFRFNNRATKDNPLADADRFALAVSQISGKKLTYAELTGKVGETETFKRALEAAAEAREARLAVRLALFSASNLAFTSSCETPIKRRMKVVNVCVSPSISLAGIEGRVRIALRKESRCFLCPESNLAVTAHRNGDSIV